MYAHLSRQSCEPVPTAGYSARCRCRFSYGSIAIETELRVPELSEDRQLDFTIYSTLSRARLMHGELPKRSNGRTPASEDELLEELLPRGDISYVTGLFGLSRRGYSANEVRRRRIELPSGRKYKWYERHEICFTHSVRSEWLERYGGLFGAAACGSH